jgi:transcription elongation GreA/GreB family factor
MIDFVGRLSEVFSGTVDRAREAYAATQASAHRAALAAAGRDLRYWSARRATARVVPAPTDHSELRFGTSVTIAHNDGGKVELVQTDLR